MVKKDKNVKQWDQKKKQKNKPLAPLGPLGAVFFTPGAGRAFSVCGKGRKVWVGVGVRG